MDQLASYRFDEAFAEEMDRDDELSEYRKSFHLPMDDEGRPFVYFDGNSLGLQAKTTTDAVIAELEDWQRLGVEGHFAGRSPWAPYHELLTASLASLVGAEPSEVVAMNTLTVNLHLLMVSFYRPTKKRYKILTGPHGFPSDRYALQSQARFHGFDPDDAVLELPSHDGLVKFEDYEAILKEQGDDIALIWLEGVNYYTGQALNLKAHAELAHKYRIPIGFDLAHAVGNIPLQLHDSGIDFAVWCHYKYCNGGPGCVGGAFVHDRHSEREDLPRFAGWWGHNKERRFLMEPEFSAIPGAEGWQLSNPPILPLAALRASLALLDQVGMERLRKKSETLTGYLEFLVSQIPHEDLSIITPKDPQQRGCQLSLRFRKGGKKMHEKLREHGVISDWREPDVVRIAPVPLYNSFHDVYRFGLALKACLDH